jgi:hypothetical protein
MGDGRMNPVFIPIPPSWTKRRDAEGQAEGDNAEDPDETVVLDKGNVKDGDETRVSCVDEDGFWEEGKEEGGRTRIRIRRN